VPGDRVERTELMTSNSTSVLAETREISQVRQLDILSGGSAGNAGDDADVLSLKKPINIATPISKVIDFVRARFGQWQVLNRKLTIERGKDSRVEGHVRLFEDGKGG
jgi:hypothetical protein